MVYALALYCCFWGVPEPAPPLTALHVFPTNKYVENGLEFNRKYQDYLLAEMYNRPHLRPTLVQALTDTEQLEDLYILLEMAYCEGQFHYRPYWLNGRKVWWSEKVDNNLRRASLAELRKRLGAEAFRTGALPPPVPLWACKEID